MTTNISERDISKYTPAYEPVSLREPTEAEKRIDRSLQAFMDEEMKLESDEEMMRRDSILAEVRNIFIRWVQFVATEVLHMPTEEAEDAGGELFISGSHRLGVRDVGADIDTVCVAPNFCTREHFFTYLKADLAKNQHVTNLIAVEEAFVPVISFDFREVNIDLLFARLAENTVPRDIDILDDRILIGLDEATEKSLNGPRVTNMICELVGKKTFPNFLIVLRCIRKWAKSRGLYGNKLGYLGGINCNIMVAFICQLYPNASPSTLLFRFFKRYNEWQWPEPIMLNKIQQHPPGTLLSEERQVWSAKINVNDVMPIITPAYPAMNSAFNVNYDTLEVMKQEIRRGNELISTIIKEKSWQKLFEPADFFLKYSHYLICHIIGTGDNSASRSWTGFVQSRIRRLTQYPFLSTLPIEHPIHLYPVVSKTQNTDYSHCYFIGFNLDLDMMKQMDDKNVYIDSCAQRFLDSLLDPDRGYRGEKVEGLDFYVEHVTWKRLPKEVLEVYGGYEKAKELRLAMGYGKKQSKTTETERTEGNDDAAAGNAATENINDEVVSHPGAEAVSESKQQDEDGIDNKKKKRKLRDDHIISYALAPQWFKVDGYEDIGKAGVISIENEKRRAQEEVFGSQKLLDEQIKRRRHGRPAPVIAPPTSALFRKSIASLTTAARSSSLILPGSKDHLLPSVTWQLNDQK